jgi:hypothetical protein
MEELTKEQIYGLVKRKFSQAKAAVLQGGEKLSVAQKKVWAEAQVYFDYQNEKDKEARGRKTPDISNDRVDRFRKKEREIELPPIEDERRRARLERNTAAWLRWYLPNAFPWPFAKSHHALIEGIEWAAKTGEGFSDAEPRGQGKSTVARGVSVKLAATGVVRFPVLVNWKHADAKDALGLWLKTLCDNPRFAADYPEICAPFIRSTHATALKNLTWAHNGNKCGAMIDTLNKVITLPNSIGAIAARSAQGDAKGLNAMMPDGTILRPDFVLFDDSQDPSAADKPNAVRSTIDKLENIFLGMAGPQKRLCCALVGTVEHEDDVVDYFLKRKGGRHNRVSRIIRWPDGSQGGTWESAEGCPIRRLWDEWREIYNGEGGQAEANRFFRKNRKVMTGKMEVNWVHRFDHAKDVCAIDAAMHDWYHLGEDVFARGQQNQPLAVGTDLYTITPKLICDRVDISRNPGEVPDWCVKVLAATDVNPSYGLTTIVAGFGNDERSAVMWYGVHRTSINNDVTDAEKKRLVMAALEVHGRQLAALPCRPSLWGIDGGGSPQDTVITFCANSMRTVGIEAITMFGRAWRMYHPSSRDRKFEQVFIRSESRLRQWAIWNADYWREIAQRAWIGAVASPGSCDLPKGNHREFAEQICREQLAGKAEVGGTCSYIWRTQPGAHDFGDDMAMLYALAATAGIGTGGYVKQQGPRRTRVNVSMVKI